MITLHRLSDDDASSKALVNALDEEKQDPLLANIYSRLPFIKYTEMVCQRNNTEPRSIMMWATNVVKSMDKSEAAYVPSSLFLLSMLTSLPF